MSTDLAAQNKFEKGVQKRRVLHTDVVSADTLWLKIQWLTRQLDSIKNATLAATYIRMRDSLDAFTQGPRLFSLATVKPSSTNGWVLTTTGGVATWAAPSGAVDTMRYWPNFTSDSRTFHGNVITYHGALNMSDGELSILRGTAATFSGTSKSAIVNKRFADSLAIHELVFGREFTVSDTSSAQAFGVGGAAGIPVASEGLIIGASWSITDASGSSQIADYKRMDTTINYTVVGLRGDPLLVRVIYYRTVGVNLRRFVVETKGRTGGSWTTRITIPVHDYDLTDPSFTGRSAVTVHLRRRYYGDTYL